MRPYLSALLLLALPASEALAHSRLLRSEPAEGVRLAEPPTEVRLVFETPVQGRFSACKLVDAKGRDQALAPPEEDEDGKVLRMAVTSKLPPGAYTARWSAVSRDGHRISGKIRFTVLPRQ